MSETTQVSFWIETNLIKDFKKVCIDEGISMSKKLEVLIRGYLKDNKRA